MTNAVKEMVRRRAGDRCEYCRIDQAYTTFTHQIDHIRALKHNGSDSLENLCLSCFACNNAKGTDPAGFDPATDQLTRLFNPRIDRWAEHFHYEGPTLVGLTPIGRTTLVVLDMNEAACLEQRENLIVVGLFPPKD